MHRYRSISLSALIVDISLTVSSLTSHIASRASRAQVQMTRALAVPRFLIEAALPILRSRRLDWMLFAIVLRVQHGRQAVSLATNESKQSAKNEERRALTIAAWMERVTASGASLMGEHRLKPPGCGSVCHPSLARTCLTVFLSARLFPSPSPPLSARAGDADTESLPLRVAPWTRLLAVPAPANRRARTSGPIAYSLPLPPRRDLSPYWSHNEPDTAAAARY